MCRVIVAGFDDDDFTTNYAIGSHCKPYLLDLLIAGIAKK
jgi:hypothetical protein